MPCNSDYLDPNAREVELKRAAGLLVFILERTGQSVTRELRETANDSYAKRDYVATLCSVLKRLNSKEFDDVVYNARDKQSRDLADWYEEHEAADRAREHQEKSAALDKKIKRQALSKLSAEERRVLGL